MSLSPQERTTILRTIKQRVLKNHINVAGVSYPEWTKLVDERTPSLLAADLEDFESGVRDLLKKLGTSHSVFYHERTISLLPQHSIGATLRGSPGSNQERWTFLDVFEDGPAHIAGIKPGDELLAVDGTPYTPPTMPPFRLGQTFTLTVSNADGRRRRDVAIAVPFRKGTKDRPPIVEPKPLAHAVIAPGVGLLKVTYFPGPMGLGFAQLLDAAVSELKRQQCTHLIVDLRGNIGGGLGFARLASYFCPGQLPIGHSLTPSRLRKGYRSEELPRVPMPQTRTSLIMTLASYAFKDKSIHLLTQGLGGQPFHGRIVLLVNQWTNSAAEMVANFAAENGLATIIGSRTAGNVLGAANFSVGSGYWVRLPIFGWYTSHGDCLEGQGVAPDFVVEPNSGLLNSGVDEHLNKAMEIQGLISSQPSTWGTSPPARLA
jgi:carboxyl-terminal processing protease